MREPIPELPRTPHPQAGLCGFGHGFPQACLGFVQHSVVTVEGEAVYADARAAYTRIVRDLLKLDLQFFSLLRREQSDGENSVAAGCCVDLQRLGEDSFRSSLSHNKTSLAFYDV